MTSARPIPVVPAAFAPHRAGDESDRLDRAQHLAAAGPVQDHAEVVAGDDRRRRVPELLGEVVAQGSGRPPCTAAGPAPNGRSRAARPRRRAPRAARGQRGWPPRAATRRRSPGAPRGRSVRRPQNASQRERSAAGPVSTGSRPDRRAAIPSLLSQTRTSDRTAPLKRSWARIETLRGAARIPLQWTAGHGHGHDHLAGGETSAQFVPGANLLCSSLTHQGVELLDLGRGVEAYAQRGKTMGIPLLYPWANRAQPPRIRGRRPHRRPARPRRPLRPRSRRSADPWRAAVADGVGGEPAR